MKRICAIDLGSNTVRLLVAEASGTAWRALYEDQRVTRLGQGQAITGRLDSGAMRRTVETVADFVRRAKEWGARDIRIVATSAVREAANREELLAMLGRATGRQALVVSGEDEARLTLLGVSGGLPDLGGDFLLFDIGGGSTEFVQARAGRAVAAMSLKLGVVELAERFMGSGPVDAAAYDAMAAEVSARLDAGVTEPLLRHGAPALVGCAGTVTTLAALDLDLASYDSARVHGHRLTRRVVEGLRRRLGALSLAERAALPCLEPGRADLIVPGAAICLAVFARLGFEALVVSDRGLREGILYEILAGD